MRQPTLRERYKSRKRPDGSEYTESTLSYFTTIGGKTYGLGNDPKAAKKRFGELLAGYKPKTGSSPNPIVADLVNRYLTWCGNPNNCESSTCEWYRIYLESFKAAIGPRLRVADLKKHHVTEWIDTNYKDAKANTRNRARSCAKRAPNWVDEDLIERSPIAKCKMQKGEHRERYLEEVEWFELLKLLENSKRNNFDDFRDYLTVLWECGCRLQEATLMEERWFQVIDREAKQGRWVFPTKKSKGKRQQRIVYLTPVAFEITERLAAKFPEGQIFRQRGKPWDKNTIRCKFRRLKAKLGIPELCAYTLRHSASASSGG
jgi:integrase